MKGVFLTFPPALTALPVMLFLVGCAGTPPYTVPVEPIERQLTAERIRQVDQTLTLDIGMIRELMRENPHGMSANLTTGQKVAIGIGAAVAVILIVDWVEDEVAFFPSGP